MIINKRTGFAITDPEEVFSMPDHMLDEFRQIKDDSEYMFFVPPTITENRLKIVYKVGFLKKFYMRLYPDMSKADIYGKINKRWQVFVGVRQMERHWNTYQNLFEKKRGA